MWTGVSVGRGGPRLYVGMPFNPVPMLILIGIFAVVVSGALPAVGLFVLLFIGIIVGGWLFVAGLERLIVYGVARHRASRAIPTREAIQWPDQWHLRGRSLPVRPYSAEWQKRYRQGYEGR